MLVSEMTYNLGIWLIFLFKKKQFFYNCKKNMLPKLSKYSKIS